MGIREFFPEKNFEFEFDEDIWYLSASPRTSVLNIEMSGITHPDPSYRICRDGNWNFYVIACITKGKGSIECGGRHYSLYAGDTFLLRALTVHEYRSDPTDPFEMLWINVSGTMVSNLLQAYNLMDPVIVRRADLSPHFYRLREHTLTQYNALAAETEIAALLVALAHSETQEEVRNCTTPEKIKEYIDLHPGVTAEAVAAQFYITPAHARRLFRRQYGITVHQYVSERTLTTAKQLLLSSEYSVGEISDMLGYCDDNYFSAVFKKQFGLSPMQFRMQNRKRKNSNTAETDLPDGNAFGS